MKWPAVDPGLLRHQITILTQGTQSTIAGQSPVWTPLLSTYAAIEPMRGTELIKSGQDTAQLFLIVTIRWQAGIAPNMRVKALNGTYLIQTIENPLEMNAILKLLCIGIGANE